MQRFINNYGSEMANNDSVFSCDYNWSEISIGNDTIQSDNFFGNLFAFLFQRVLMILHIFIDCI